MTNNQCAACGKNTENVRFVACGAASMWAKRGSTHIQFEKRDDLKVWKVGLCEDCFPASYKIFLENDIKRNKPMFIMSIVGFLGIGLLIWILKMPSDSPSMKVSRIIVPFFIVGFFIFSIIGLVVSTRQIIKNRNRLNNLKKMGGISEAEVKHCFHGEGERVISVLENKDRARGEKVWGDFPLPVFKQFTDLFINGERVKDYVEISDGKKRKIVGVARTMEEMEKEIYATWKPLLLKG